MESRKPVRNLSETIHSLLGLKAHLTSAWVKSVCNIVKNASFEQASSPSALKAKNFQTRDSFGSNDDQSASTKVQMTKDELSALTVCVNELNIQRKQFLNDFLDLKGNIRVFCRIRPIRVWENSRHVRPVVASDSRNVILKISENKSRSYNFDKVFHPDSLQDEVFSEIEPVIKSVLDGYNACIFAYGQTGTGKTFTMEGTVESPGIVPRAIEALFAQALESNHAFLISFSMLEIYLGNLQDLLVRQPTRPTDPVPPCLSIHTDPKGGIEIENLVAIKVSDFHQAMKLYRLGCRYRSTASTNSNMQSSRSHWYIFPYFKSQISMIRISITCFGAPERRRKTNKIWLVDLGGSERVLKTKALGRRLNEGKAINLSLSALGDVISALQRKNRHIPYRNSKLTQVLKDSLGQDSKTLMLVHVSPKEQDLCETICSLNFATRAKRIHLGQEEPTEERGRKEAAMTNLLQKMENVEEERQRVLRDIKKLNQKLKNLTGRGQSSAKDMEETYLSADERSYDQEATKNKSGNVRTTSSTGLPSFMRPTVSSRRKSGTGNQTSDLVIARRRRPRSHRADSITFPVKKFAEYTSDRSISKSTCVIDLTTKSNADNVTEHSQDISESDIKVVVSEHKKTSQQSSNRQWAHFSNLERYENGAMNIGNSTKFSRVDSWLRLQKNEPNNCTYSHRKKQVLATSVTEKAHKLEESNTIKTSPNTLPNVKVCTNKFVFQRIVSHKKIDKQNNVEEIEDPKTEEAIDKPVVMPKDFFTVEETQNSEDEMITDESERGSLYSPTAGYDGFSQCMDDNKESMVAIMEETNAEEWLPDRFMEDDVDYSAYSERESLAYVSILEQASHCNQMFTEMAMEEEERENDIASPLLTPKGRTLCLLKPTSQKALFMDNGYAEEQVMQFVTSQERMDEKGTVHIIKQKFRTLCFSALLGLGFLGLGYEQDFFHGLIL